MFPDRNVRQASHVQLFQPVAIQLDLAWWMQSQEDGKLASSPASDGALADVKSLANVYKLGERKWRRNSKRPEACAYTAPFTALTRRWRGEADVQDGGAESST
jgi:hypothetical protein